ncbi:hypothetical protein MAR_035447 [Mya arenaria]|uniref:Uncharacterized protein n=1 Tax=Mya arenaria TaxID=6604 RepID=A0ABY7ENR0_MYAAR|nr:hypothetical protein MAR_035447 [Mya arenaria]
MSRGPFPVLVEEKTDAPSYWDTDAENSIFKSWSYSCGKLKVEIMMAVAYLSFTKLPLRLRPACKTKVKKHNKVHS